MVFVQNGVASAKLIKKRELKMSTVFNNVKHYTINIYKPHLILLLFCLQLYPVSAFYADNEKKWVIVIDAGHGGKDPGAIGKISYERDIVLAVALKTGEMIKKNIKNVKVIYTRDNDSFVELGERADIANRNKADLFISIHANGNPSSNARGTETYIMGLSKDEANLQVAMKENEVILLEKDYTTKYEGFDPKSPESYIIFTLMQNVFREQSTYLASLIQTQYKERVNRADRGVQEAGFYVLFMTTMPSVLTEIGFITNPTEEKYINSTEGQEYISSAIFRACRDYINDVNSKSGLSMAEDTVPQQADKAAPTEPVKELTDVIEFKVQVASSATKKEINPKNFRGLTDISEIAAPDRYRYTSGSFKNYTDAADHRKKLETIYPDAFVVAVKDNKMVPLQQALDQQNNNKKQIK
jgi:N-acetylmuramoyl-L-alanine amidase